LSEITMPGPGASTTNTCPVLAPAGHLRHASRAGSVRGEAAEGVARVEVRR